MKRLLDVIDWFTPDSLIGNDQPDLLVRARILIAVIVGSNLIAVMMYLSTAGLASFDNQSVYVGAAFIVLLTVFLFICLNIFKYTASFGITANLFGVSIFIPVGLSVMITGGYGESPTLPMFLIIPMLVFALSGAKSGLAWTVIVCIAILVFFLLSERGVVFRSDLSESHTKASYLMGLLTIAWCSALSLSIHHFINRRLMNLLFNERNQFEHEATHDSLTGLVNRKVLDRKLIETIDKVILNDSLVVFALLLVDNFKKINEDQGHQIGDLVLKSIGGRLDSSVTHADMVARMGGAEFALIIDRVPSKEEAKLLLEEVLKTLSEPMNIAGHDIAISVSIGAAFCPDHGDEVDLLHLAAGKALHDAKENNLGVVIFSE